MANMTRQDGVEFLKIARDLPLDVKAVAYSLEEANRALSDLREDRLEGAAVLVIGHAHFRRH